MRVASLLLLAATTVRAHIVPVPPSTCAFEPVTVGMPAAGLIATGAPPAPGDLFHILYDPQASSAQFNLTGVPPRSFSATGVTGSFSVSPIFGAALANDGNLQATPTFTFTTPAGTASASIALTTGLVVAGDAVLEGVPLSKASGTFALTGVLDPSSLPAPLTGGPLVIRLGGVAVPPPDTDQFRIATQTTVLSAAITAKLAKARFIFAPGTNDQPDFPGRTALLRISTGDTTITTANLPSGLAAHGKKLFIGRSADGRAALGVHTLRRSGQVAYLFAVKLKTPTLPAAAGAVPTTITYDVGGLLSRVTVSLHPKRGGALLRYP